MSAILTVADGDMRKAVTTLQSAHQVLTDYFSSGNAVCTVTVTGPPTASSKQTHTNAAQSSLSTHPPNTPTDKQHITQTTPQFYGKGLTHEGGASGTSISPDAIREMSGGVPDGVIKQLWAAIRSQAFDNVKVRPSLIDRGVCVRERVMWSAS